MKKDIYETFGYNRPALDVVVEPGNERYNFYIYNTGEHMSIIEGWAFTESATEAIDRIHEQLSMILAVTQIERRIDKEMFPPRELVTAYQQLGTYLEKNDIVVTYYKD